jgi:hypothetical protein
MSILALQGQVEALHQEVQASGAEFCLDLEGICADGRPLWQWMDYSRKDNAARSLIKLVEGVDYQSAEVRTVAGGTPRQVVLFSREGFKQWAMLAGTERGRQIRSYFIECEKRLQLQMSQPTSLNKVIEDLTEVFVSGINGVHSKVDALGTRLAGVESSLCEHGKQLECLTEQLCNEVYTCVRVSDRTIKIGFTTNLDERLKEHEGRRGFTFVDHMPGTTDKENRLKAALRLAGHKAKYGNEQFWLCPEVLQVLKGEGWPTGDLCCTPPKTAMARHGKKADPAGLTPSML